MLVEKLQRQDDLRRVEPRPGLVELACPLDLEHEVAAVDVLHHEEQPVLGLVARVERGQERVVGRQGQDPLLGHRALDVVVLDDHVLLEDLDGEHLLRVLLLGQHDLAERPLAQDLQEAEVFQRRLALAALALDQVLKGGLLFG